MEECFDGHARITSQELASTHSVKSGTLQNACSTRQRVVVGLVRSALMHIVRLMNNQVKGPKKNDDKSAVAMMKKNDLHDRTWQPVVNRDKSHERLGRPDVMRDTCHELKHGPVGCRSSNTRQLGCVFQDMKPPKSILRKSSEKRREEKRREEKRREEKRREEKRREEKGKEKRKEKRREEKRKKKRREEKGKERGKDYLKGTCKNSFCEKWHPPECLFYKTKSGCRFGEKCSFAHRQVDEQPTKRSKKNDDKSAVAMLKKGNWQEREPVTDECHDRPGKRGKKSDKKFGQKII